MIAHSLTPTIAQEWLEFHLLVGVEHFYIFDDSSADNAREVSQTTTSRHFHPSKMHLCSSLDKDYLSAPAVFILTCLRVLDLVEV